MEKWWLHWSLYIDHNINIQFGLEGVFQEIITCITDMVINFIEEINIWIYVK